MKFSKLLILVFSLTILAFYGCIDNSLTNTEPVIKPPTPEDFDVLSEAALASRTQTAQFNAEEGISFTSEKGVRLSIPAGCLSLNGNSASGPAELEYVELFDRSDMLVTNKTTMGLMANEDKKILVSGGAFYINVTQDGNPLGFTCDKIQLVVPGKLTGGIDEDMIMWSGKIDSSGDLTWKKNQTGQDSTGSNGGTVFIKGPYYVTYFGTFGWTNVDRFRKDPRPKTTLQVRPPEGYNIYNSAVYLSYDGEDHALAKLDTYNETTGLFSEHYGQVPIGLEMHIIFVTEQDGQWRYTIKGVTVADNDLYTFTLDETVVGSEQDLIDAIEALP